MTKVQPIDAVITWVNGKDPLHEAKKAKYLPQKIAKREDQGAATRYNSVGEIYYCVASVLRNAAFVRQIFIVTDAQDPKLEDFVAKNFPQSKTIIQIIDHTEVFSGFEEFLPTFNSLSIETLLFKIPGLAENFIYLNDDFFILRKTEPHHFFNAEKVLAYGSWKSVAADSLLSKLKPLIKGRKTFGFKDSMLNAAQLLNLKKRYFRIQHTPLPQKKSTLQRYFNSNPEALRKNIEPKFRSSRQFNPQALFYLLAEQEKSLSIETRNRELLIKPKNKPLKYVVRKTKTFEENKQLMFCCIESADLATDEVREYLFGWLREILNIEE